MPVPCANFSKLVEDNPVTLKRWSWGISSLPACASTSVLLITILTEESEHPYSYVESPSLLAFSQYSSSNEIRSVDAMLYRTCVRIASLHEDQSIDKQPSSVPPSIFGKHRTTTKIDVARERYNWLNIDIYWWIYLSVAKCIPYITMFSDLGLASSSGTHSGTNWFSKSLSWYG